MGEPLPPPIVLAAIVAAREACEGAAVGDAPRNAAALLQAGVLQAEFGRLRHFLEDQAQANAARGPRDRQPDARVTPLSSTSGNTWLRHLEHFNTIAEINGWDALRQKRQLKVSLVGDAADRIRTSDPNNAAQNFAEFATELGSKFVSAVDSQVARTLFFEAKQKSSETVADWHTRLLGLHQRAFAVRPNRDTDEDLRHVFGAGLKDHAVLVRTVGAALNTLAEQLRIANAEETAQRIYRARFGGGDKGNHAMAPQGTDGPGDELSTALHALGIAGEQQQETVIADVLSNIECFYCGRKGHRQRECRQLATDEGRAGSEAPAAPAARGRGRGRGSGRGRGRGAAASGTASGN